MTIELRLKASQTKYVVGEDISVDIEIENKGSATVSIPDPESNANWQPVYELTGPGPNDVARFDFRAVVRGKNADPLGPADASLIEIAPGATHSASLYLSGLVPVTKAGSYSLTARIEWDSVDVSSAPLGFSLEALSARSFNYGVGFAPDGAPEIHAAYLHDGAKSSVLLQASFGEDRPDLGEMSRRSIYRVAELSPSAQDVLVPWANHSRLEDLIGWVLWREGSELCGQPTMGLGPLRMALPFVPALWAEPALEAKNHDIDLFVVGGAANRTLSMIRVVHGGFSKPPSGSVLWSFELPEPVVGAAVSPAPNAFGTERHLAFVSESAQGVTLRHAIVKGTAQPASLTETVIAGKRAHPKVRPAILAHEKGGARVTVLLLDPESPTRYLLAEQAMGNAHPNEPISQDVTIDLPSPLASGQTRYFRDPVSGVFRRDYALRTADGATFCRDNAGAAVLVRPAMSDPAPLSLIVLRDTSYLLERSPAGVLHFEHV